MQRKGQQHHSAISNHIRGRSVAGKELARSGRAVAYPDRILHRQARQGRDGKAEREGRQGKQAAKTDGTGNGFVLAP